MAGVMTPIGWLYFPHFYKAKANKAQPQNPPRFSGMLLLDQMGLGSQAYQALRTEVFNALVEKFGAAKANDPNFVRTLRMPFRPASEKNYEGFSDGQIFISAWSSEGQPPGVVDLTGQQIRDEKAVWGGQLARFTVRPFAYDTSGNKGVSFGLEHVQIVRADLPRRDGGVAAEDAFKNGDTSQLAALGIDPAAMSSAMAGAAAMLGQTAYQAAPPPAAPGAPVYQQQPVYHPAAAPAAAPVAPPAPGSTVPAGLPF